MEKSFDNQHRFTGIAKIYQETRPRFPDMALKILMCYLRQRPSCAVDLGCGTGLSTRALTQISTYVIGIDNNEDMLAQAKAEYDSIENVVFQCGVAEHIPLDSDYADLVLCSQSLHWMDPKRAIPEICRILRRDGVFAAVDYDWPAVFDWRCEQAYKTVIQNTENILCRHPELSGTSHKWDKGCHLENLKKFGSFRYVREVVFNSPESCTGDRFCRMVLSQSGIQAVLRSRYVNEITEAIAELSNLANQAYTHGKDTIYIPYRLRLGIR